MVKRVVNDNKIFPMLNKSEQVWMSLDKSGQVSLNGYEWVKTSLNDSEQVWASVNKSENISLNKFE